MTSEPGKKSEVWRWFKALHVMLLVAIIAAVANYIFDLYSKGEIMRNMHDGRLEYADYLIFYMGGQIATGKDATHFYDAVVQLKYFNQLLSPYSITRPVFLLNPPITCLSMMPYVMLPPDQSYLVWLALITLFGAVSVGLWFKNAVGLSRLNGLIVYLHALASYPSLVSLRMGQQAWNYASLLSLYLLGLYKKIDWLAGATLALLTQKPHYALFFALPAFFNKRFKVLIIAFVCEIVLLIATGFTIGWSNVINYPHMVLHADVNENFLGLDVYKQVCLRGFASLYLPQNVALKIGLFSWLLGLAGATYIWWRTIRAKLTTLNQQRWALAATLTLCMTCSPHTHSYDLLLLAPLVFTVFPKMSGSHDALTGEVEPASGAFLLWRIVYCAYPLASWVIIIGGALLKVSPFTVMLVVNITLTVVSILLWCRQLRRVQAVG